MDLLSTLQLKKERYGSKLYQVGYDKTIFLISLGRVNEIKANVEKSTPVAFLHVKLEPNTKWFHYIPKEHHALFYIIGGSIDVTGRNIGQVNRGNFFGNYLEPILYAQRRWRLC